MSDKKFADKKLLDKKLTDKKMPQKSSSLKGEPLLKSSKAPSSIPGPSLRKETTLIGAQSCTALPRSSAPEGDEPSKELLHLGLPIPSQELLGSDEEWSDADSVASARASMLPATGREPSIIMDLTTQRANEILQQGKNALEKAGNMKKECKTEVNGSLQGLYEIVLSLSYSREKQMIALEQEKGRAAKELVRCERAHAKELAAIQQDHAVKLKKLEENTAGALKTAEQIKNWINLELDGPLKTIANTYSELKELSSRPLPTTTVKERIYHASGGVGPQPINIQLAELASKMETVLEQLQCTRADIERWHQPKDSIPQLRALELQPHTSLMANLEEVITTLKNDVSGLTQILQTKQSMASVFEYSDPKSLCTHQNVQELLAPVLCYLGEAKKERAELKDILQDNSRSREGSNVLGPETTLTEIKQQLSNLLSRPVQEVSTVTNLSQDMDRVNQSNTGPRIEYGRSYAQVARRLPSVPRYNVLVESLDPRHTSDDVVQKLKSSVNIIDRGIGVSAIRRSKNQRVIVSCESEREQKSFSEALRQADQSLSAKQLPNKPPLLKLAGLAKDLNDAQVTEAILKQNKTLIEDIPAEQQYIKIIRRTKGRNDVLTNAIMEVDPKIWRALVDQRIRVGYQVLVAYDQSPIVQCYKCLGFGHMARVCTEKVTCGYCADLHDTRDCPRREVPPQCINCCKDGKTLTPSHPAYSSECPLWQKWDRIARSRVNYC
ncbi:PREDICTED: uncharacterized protein LOC106105027 [Papilio polytes]|uniref:uncharacterized protein LOC106105027 n=1 Tax=Papilio polytes TaxID=76194 RepID=UPI0006761685|nr:PREDICTED: uncharacterized protein LOC106105027 [Papilio polytes]